MRVPTARVRELRCNPTEAERAAWYLLRGRRLGAKFRRQCRIQDWVVDFYCFEHRLAIELDGGVHSQPSQMRKDASKEDYLRTLGISLLRIPNGRVLEDPEEFARRVRAALKVETDEADTTKQPLTRSRRASPPPCRDSSPLPWGEGVALRRSHQPEPDG